MSVKNDDDSALPQMQQQPYYAVEVRRLGRDGMNVMYDHHNHPETTDFAINNGPSFVRLLDGTDALVIRSCVNRTGCSTPHNPDVITLVKRNRSQPVNLQTLQAQFERNSLDRIILRPKGTDEQCGVQDPRITVDRTQSVYYMAYTAYGDDRQCNRSLCGPTWQQCSRCCRTVKTKVVVSKTPEVESSWVRINRTGDAGFDEKSTSTLIMDAPPHYQWTGTGTVRSWVSSDLRHWTQPEESIRGRPGHFDPGYVEAGAPPVRLTDGNFFTTSQQNIVICLLMVGLPGLTGKSLQHCSPLSSWLMLACAMRQVRHDHQFGWPWPARLGGRLGGAQWQQPSPDRAAGW
jgi:hypothetical protein